ncbi:MAG: RNA-binding S4 domain-containing protein [Chitinophagales bacterium]
MSDNSESKVRVDKWLWAVRVFKTRTLASDACKAGRVKIEGKSVKSSRMVQVGDTISSQKGQEKKVLKVVKLIEKRVSAKLAVECYEDFSPPPIPRTPSELQKSAFWEYPAGTRERGTGRPTKKERRVLDDFYDDFDEEDAD